MATVPLIKPTGLPPARGNPPLSNATGSALLTQNLSIQNLSIQFSVYIE